MPIRTLTPERKKKAAEATRRWKDKNPEYKERRNEVRRAWGPDHPESIKRNIRTAKWKSAHPSYDAERCARARIEALDIWNCTCVKCGYNKDLRALEVDHINGDGYLERNGKRGGAMKNYRHWVNLIADPQVKEKFQLLCANCHKIKTFENNEHKRRVTNENDSQQSA